MTETVATKPDLPEQSFLNINKRVIQRKYQAIAFDRPALRPENIQPPRNVPSSAL